MLQSTGAQGCGLSLHCRAGVAVAPPMVQRRAGARGIGSVAPIINNQNLYIIGPGK
jgi:hypothetical protein